MIEHKQSQLIQNIFNIIMYILYGFVAEEIEGKGGMLSIIYFNILASSQLPL